MALLALRITDKCNLNCKYCYAHTEFQEDMDFLTAKTAIEEFIKKFKNFKIQITGGEPFMNFGLIEEIYNYLKEKKIEASINIQTNGTLFNLENLKKIQDMKAEISISLDGFGKINDILRPGKTKNKTFELVNDGIDLMGQMGMKTQLNAVLTGVNVNELEKLFDYALLKGNIRGISLDVLRNINKGVSVKSATVEEVNILLEKIEEKLDLADSLGMEIELKDFSKMIYLLANNKKMNEYCYAQTEKSIVVKPNGDYYPCSSLAGNKNFLLGNIKEGIGKIKIFPELKEYIETCKDCDIIHLCCGGCPAGRYYGERNLDCAIKKYSYKYALKKLKID